MPKTPKKVEALIPVIRVNEGTAPSFEELITSSQVISNTFDSKGKTIAIQIVEHKKDFIFGIVKTNQRINIPPGMTINNETSALPLPIGGGIGYGNGFIYYKKANVILYEINKNGCFPDTLIAFLHSGWNSEHNNTPFDLKLSPVFEKDEYKRIIEMNRYKTVELSFQNPAHILQFIHDKTGPIVERIREATMANSDFVSIKWGIYQKPKFTLDGSFVRNAMSFIKDQIISNGDIRNDIDKIVVSGYSEDYENGKKLDPIDLMGKRITGDIRLTTKQLHDDLQVSERKQEFVNLLQKLQPKLDASTK